MKTREVLLIGVLCLGLIMTLGLAGCGSDGDSCREACEKVAACGALGNETVDECTNDCSNESNAQKDCALACDRGLDCNAYGACLIGCGVT